MEVAEVEGDHVPSVVPELPSEIIWFLILPRLPAKSLMRFKCVCKSWSSLISGNPTFLGVHRNLRCNNNRYTHLLLNVFDRNTGHDHLLSVQTNQVGDGDGSTSPASATHLLTLTPDYHLYDYQCTNGLFCNFYFAKPVATKTHHEHDPEDHIKGHFGFSPLTNEYKLLQVQLCHDWTSNLFSLKLKILTLRSDSWGCIEVYLDQLPFNPLSSHLYGESVCLHGALHWIYQGGEDRSRIVVFDLGEERFKVIATPEDDGSDPCWTIAEVGGRLALMDDKDAMPQKLMLELWILTDYQNQVWAKETINFPSHLAGVNVPSFEFFTYNSHR
ncbi:F-box/kelch-repeat protein [Prunus yedoensis var. nudiflora]|uniref:F-box/kelch-repeat protein n=1 Tax=Prunus yedoensis var. nudiflora TaxID=2094558 RepID=A0A314ZNQ4_PRUYE|nr:F-box/kelch-repeat protein [Prunus yedoensis var. nudiflora]